MSTKKEFETLKAELSEIKERLILLEERRNSQYTDLMNAITSLTEALQEDDPDHWEDDGEPDEMFDEVKEFIITELKASTSLIQRRFRVGYGRAACLMDQLESEGVISPSEGTNKPRKVLIDNENAE